MHDGLSVMAGSSAALYIVLRRSIARARASTDPPGPKARVAARRPRDEGEIHVDRE